jgi:hypothetical protein
MKKLLLAMALLAMPVLPFATVATPAFAATTANPLGDLSALRAIVSDTSHLAAAGDLTKAATRITDFESAWDADASKLRALSTDNWGVIDDASDAALAVLRAPKPTASDVDTTLKALLAALDNPTLPAAKLSTVAMTAAKPGVTTTDANGRPLPCEDMLKAVRDGATGTTISAADKAKVDDLQSKGIERCNADDDKRADDFFGQALTLMGK